MCARALWMRSFLKQTSENWLTACPTTHTRYVLWRAPSSLHCFLVCPATVVVEVLSRVFTSHIFLHLLFCPLVQVFPQCGHLDFTLGQDDTVISHVLRILDEQFSAASPSTTATTATSASSAAAPTTAARPALSSTPRTKPSHAAQQHVFLNSFTNAAAVFQSLEALYQDAATFPLPPRRRCDDSDDGDGAEKNESDNVAVHGGGGVRKRIASAASRPWHLMTAAVKSAVAAVDAAVARGLDLTGV